MNRFSILIGMFVFMGLGCFPGSTIKEPTFSNYEERVIGLSLLAPVANRYGGSFHDPKIQQHLTRLGNRISALTPNNEVSLVFRIFDTSKKACFSLPGGTICLTRGFLVDLPDEASLVGAIAHEAAHLSSRDQALRLSREFSIEKLEAAGRGEPVPLRSLLRLLDADPADPSIEMAADKWACEAMTTLGYHPDALTKLLKSLNKSKISGSSPPVPGSGLIRKPISPERLNACVSAAKAAAMAAPSGPDSLGRSTPSFKSLKSRFEEIRRVYLYFDEGHRQLTLRNATKALRNFDRAIALEGDRASFFIGKGRAYLLAEKTVYATDMFQKAFLIDSDNFEAQYRCGLGLMHNAGSDVTLYREARWRLERAVSLDGTSAKALIALAEAFIGIGNGEEARQHLELAEELVDSGSVTARQLERVRRRLP